MPILQLLWKLQLFLCFLLMLRVLLLLAYCYATRQRTRLLCWGLLQQVDV